MHCREKNVLPKGQKATERKGGRECLSKSLPGVYLSFSDIFRWKWIYIGLANPVITEVLKSQQLWRQQSAPPLGPAPVEGIGMWELVCMSLLDPKFTDIVSQWKLDPATRGVLAPWTPTSNTTSQAPPTHLDGWLLNIYHHTTGQLSLCSMLNNELLINSNAVTIRSTQKRITDKIYYKKTINLYIYIYLELKARTLNFKVVYRRTYWQGSHCFTGNRTPRMQRTTKGQVGADWP